MRRISLVLLLFVSACDAKTPVSPSAVVLPVASPPVVSAPLPPVVVVPPPVVVVIPPPAPSTRPFSRNDCDFNTPLGAIRCFNPSGAAVTLTAALNSPDCGTSFGAHTITIQAGTNGYFTLPSPACGRTAQIDVYFGSAQGSCRAPDFSSQRTYTGPACPPPPTPTCVDPGFPAWPSNTPPVCTPKVEYRYRTKCDGTVERDERTVCR